MKIARFIPVLGIVAALAVMGILAVKQHRQIRHLQQSRHGLAAQYQALSQTNASLLSVDAAIKDRVNDLEQRPSEVLRLRSQLTQAQEKLAAAAARNQTPTTETSNDLTGYVAREKLSFVGFDTPENSFQSLNWAVKNGDYTNWLAALGPEALADELANTNSLADFQRQSLGKITGMQVLASKSVGDNRVELKVRLESENSTILMIFPMVQVGNEWKLIGEIDQYTTAWDSRGRAP